eukprot:gnl/TRDRNA2_/TRDRNA2_173633_c4_seq8.p1 gnl/TRDRNA2_/TRDRNA2_173633_c4~~gnl/TRDRNA2_/TRDRNA2_173633_c4_seq8.p1  ORF type:complete len:166 (-),score=26.59 gnl/TRDRNA2_/TRDRNA2_173633_c4_seq8:417-914(-)
MFVEQAMKSAQPDTDTLLMEQRREELQFREEVQNWCQTIDVNGDGTLSRAEFVKNLQQPRGKHMLKLLGIDVLDAELFFECILTDAGKSGVNVSLFTECAMKVKGWAKALDIQILQYETRINQRKYDVMMQECLAQLQKVSTSLQELKQPRRASKVVSVHPIAGV